MHPPLNVAVPKTWIKTHKDTLGLSAREYKNLRKGYLDARKALEDILTRPYNEKKK